MHTRARITTHQDQDICRLDVAAAPWPVLATTSKDAGVLFVRMKQLDPAVGPG